MYLHSFLLLILFVSAKHILCIINGEFVEWNRHANLVKIFARERNSEIITSCSGSLISSSLILTAPKCLLNQTTNERLDEIIISYPTFRRPKTVPADIVDITDSWALLKITPLKHEMVI
ncbi:hypothetical protein AB6A40_007640 [Gnathostoma spinigerum]|uniref:Peptidase S1 domain-containing protein n=1 Tax=Gnathostoma spinigerum TaxID=75299 RepID=A0ABD6EMB8_9BILA